MVEQLLRYDLPNDLINFFILNLKETSKTLDVFGGDAEGFYLYFTFKAYLQYGLIKKDIFSNLSDKSISFKELNHIN